MKPSILIVVLFVAVAYGQQPKPAPLKCGQYQHEESVPAYCVNTCGPTGCMCLPPETDKCVDDMHQVTEREWQELMKRLRALERKGREPLVKPYYEQDGNFCTLKDGTVVTCPPEPGK